MRSRKFESMEVGDDDFRPVYIIEHVAGNKFTAGVVAVGIVGLQNAQAILDRQAGCADQKAARELLARRDVARR